MLILQKFLKSFLWKNDFNASTSCLKMMLQNSEKQLKVLNEENEQLEAQILDMKLNDEKLDKQITETEKDLKKIEEREKKIQEKYRELAEKTKQRENLAKEIERRKKTVRIEVAGSSDLIPVLVECNTWGFRVKQTASGEITTIGSRNSVLSKHISELSTVLKKFNRNNVFIILLFKPGTLRYLRDVESAARGFELGKELVLDEEEIL